MKPITLLLSFLTFITLSSCRIETRGSKQKGPEKTITVDAKDFNSISLEYPSTVTFIPSDTFSVTVKAPEKELSDIDVKVAGHKLQISKRNGSRQNFLFHGNFDSDAHIVVKAPTLDGVWIIGSATFNCDSTIASRKLELNITGSGDIDIKDIQAKSVLASIVGSGDIDAGLTRVNFTEIEISGSGDIDMDFHDCKSVNANIAGSGDVELKGNVETFSQSVSGAGSINISKLRVVR